MVRTPSRLLVLALVVAALTAPSSVGATPDAAATVRFGNPEAGSAFPPPLGHDQSPNAKDNMIPRTAVIARGGAVTFEIDGLHQPAIYRPGTTPDDIAVPPAGQFVNDPNNRLVLGPLNTPPATTTFTSPAGTFDEPGAYLVICNFRPHFANFDMYGWVMVH
jgi:hypothetical protein